MRDISKPPPQFQPQRHDHALCISLALSEAEAVCEKHLARFTALRRRVLEIIWQSHCPIGAYKILETLTAEGHSSAPPTVYRALEFLLNHGLVHRIASLNSYVGCGHPGHASHCQFLICGQCEVVVELNDQAVDQVIRQRATALGFTATDHTVEIVGLCPNCQTDTGELAEAAG